MTGEFSIPLRVYIEDTDAGGIVYYVNYLKFMERARTEFMRSLGYDKNAILTGDLMFVVSRAEVDYRRSARLDDQLLATAVVQRARGAAIEFYQEIRRCGEVLASARITVACVERDEERVRRLPAAMARRLIEAQADNQ